MPDFSGFFTDNSVRLTVCRTDRDTVDWRGRPARVFRERPVSMLGLRRKQLPQKLHPVSGLKLANSFKKNIFIKNF